MRIEYNLPWWPTMVEHHPWLTVKCLLENFSASQTRTSDEPKVNTIKPFSSTSSSGCTHSDGAGWAVAPLNEPIQRPECLSRAVKRALRLPSDRWFIISQTQACQPCTLRQCAMHTTQSPLRPDTVPCLFAKLSQFILMTTGESTWPIYEAVSTVSVSTAPLLHRPEIQVLQEMTVWNLNISNHGKCNILVTWAIWDLAHPSQGQ